MSVKRDDILRATVQLVCEEGVQASSMSRIARRAGVGMGTIYNYFDSKETLLGELYVTHGDHLRGSIFSNFPTSGSFEERFKHVWRAMIQHFEAHPEEFHFAERVRHSSALPDASREQRLQMWSDLDDLFAEARSRQIVGDIDLGVFLAMLHGAIGGYLGQPNPHAKPTLERVLDGFWQALTGPSAGS